MIGCGHGRADDTVSAGGRMGNRAGLSSGKISDRCCCSRCIRRAWMKRREFIVGLGGAAAWPLVAWAQQTDRIRRIGILTGQAADDPQWIARFDALKKGLLELGWEDGKNISFDCRHAVGTPDQLYAVTAEMVSSHVDVILAG